MKYFAFDQALVVNSACNSLCNLQLMIVLYSYINDIVFWHATKK